MQRHDFFLGLKGGFLGIRPIGRRIIDRFSFLQSRSRQQKVKPVEPSQSTPLVRPEQPQIEAPMGFWERVFGKKNSKNRVVAEKAQKKSFDEIV